MSLTIGTVQASTELPHIASIEAIVIRCNCGNPQTHLDAVCPIGLVEDYGQIAYADSRNSPPPEHSRMPSQSRFMRVIQWLIKIFS